MTMSAITTLCVFDGALLFAISAFLAAMLQFQSLVQAKITKPSEKEIYLTEGQKLRLQCEEGEGLVTTGTDRLKWTRKRHDDHMFSSLQMSPVGFYTIAQERSGKEVQELIHESIKIEDSAMYRCQNYGTPADNVMVTVVHINATNWTIEKANEDAKLNCMAHDLFFTKYNHSWFRENQQIESKVNKYTLNPENGTLIIHKAGEKDTGVYVCLIHLPNGKNLTKEATVYAYPNVRNFEKSHNIREGSDLRLQCNFWGFPIPNITWSRDGVELNESYGGRLSFFYSNDTNANFQILHLHSVNFSDRARYMCLATSHSMWPGVSRNSTVLVRIKGRLAALWPFIGICIEVLILSVIIIVYEKNRTKKKEVEEAQCDGSRHLANCNTSAREDNVRHRK